ncbi:MAG: hypothetical protein ACLGH7_11980 [Actinomycetes bacterium]
MSTNEGNADPAAPELAAVTPEVQEPSGQAVPVPVLDPSATDPMADEKVRLQLAIFEVTRDADSKNLDDIQELLRVAFVWHRVETPPGTWLESVASSAFYGEPYIVDINAAVVADSIIPAPNQAVRERLASRRELREEKVPAGIFPSQDDWNVPANEVTGGSTRTAPRARWRGSSIVALAVLAAAAVAAVVAVRAGTGGRAET